MEISFCFLAPQLLSSLPSTTLSLELLISPLQPLNQLLTSNHVSSNQIRSSSSLHPVRRCLFRRRSHCIHFGHKGKHFLSTHSTSILSLLSLSPLSSSSSLIRRRSDSVWMNYNADPLFSYAPPPNPLFHDQYNSGQHNPPSMGINNDVRFLVFTGWWGFAGAVVYVSSHLSWMIDVCLPVKHPNQVIPFTLPSTF